MSKARAKNPYRNIGKIRRRRSLIRGGKDSNLPSIGISLIEIIKINMLRVNPRKKTPWEKGKTTKPMMGMQGRSDVQGFSTHKGQSEDCAQSPRGYDI
jgi:hypothetical protein